MNSLVIVLIIAGVIVLALGIRKVIKVKKENKVVIPQSSCAYGVQVNITDILTYEDICYQRIPKIVKNVDEIAKKYNCFCIMPRKNTAIYLFLVEYNQTMFYNSVKQLVKSELLKEPIKVEKEVK